MHIKRTCLLITPGVILVCHLANGPWNKSLNFIFPTKCVIPKSLKFSHWPSKVGRLNQCKTSPWNKSKPKQWTLGIPIRNLCKTQSYQSNSGARTRARNASTSPKSFCSCGRYASLQLTRIAPSADKIMILQNLLVRCTDLRAAWATQLKESSPTRQIVVKRRIIETITAIT